MDGLLGGRPLSDAHRLLERERRLQRISRSSGSLLGVEPPAVKLLGTYVAQAAISARPGEGPVWASWLKIASTW